MAAEMYVSPDGESRMRVATPETATRMRARGWRPESEPAPEPKYDRGGTLPPGETTSINKTGKPEPVIKPKPNES